MGRTGGVGLGEEISAGEIMSAKSERLLSTASGLRVEVEGG